MEVVKILIIVALSICTGILLVKKCVDWFCPQYNIPSSSIKCYSPGKCKDRYSEKCSICKYNRYKGEKSYFKARKNLNARR